MKVSNRGSLDADDEGRVKLNKCRNEGTLTPESGVSSVTAGVVPAANADVLTVTVYMTPGARPCSPLRRKQTLFTPVSCGSPQLSAKLKSVAPDCVLKRKATGTLGGVPAEERTL